MPLFHVAEFYREKRQCHYFMCRTTPFQNPATARTAGSCERTGATKAPVLSPAILPIGGFTFGFGVKACSGGSPRLPPHGLDKGHKRVFVGTGMPPRPIRPTQRLTRPNRGDFLFSLSFGPRVAKVGVGVSPQKAFGCQWQAKRSACPAERQEISARILCRQHT